MSEPNSVDPSLLEAMEKAIEKIKNQSPEEYVENVKKHRNGPISTAMRELSGFVTLELPK